MNLLSLQHDSTTDVLRPADVIEFTDTGHLNMLLKTVCKDLNVLSKKLLVTDLCLLSYFVPLNCDIDSYWQICILCILKKLDPF
jgi:hypothetical protein